MAALASGSTVRAARREKTAAIPAGMAAGATITGHHIIPLPKLALSWGGEISPAACGGEGEAPRAVPAPPAAVIADRVRSKRPVRTSWIAVNNALMSVAVLGAG